MAKAKKYETILIEKKDGITWAILNRPDKRNAMSPKMHLEMDEALDDLIAKGDALRFNDKDMGREEGIRQFLDQKTYKPGLGEFKGKKAG